MSKYTCIYVNICKLLPPYFFQKNKFAGRACSQAFIQRIGWKKKEPHFWQMINKYIWLMHILILVRELILTCGTYIIKFSDTITSEKQEAHTV